VSSTKLRKVGMVFARNKKIKKKLSFEKDGEGEAFASPSPETHAPSGKM